MTETEVLILEATAADAEELLQLLVEIQGETDFLISEQPMSILDMRTFLDNQSKCLNGICLLVKVKGQIAGLLNITSSDNEQLEHIGDLFIAVRQEFWNYGLGSFLMEAAIDWAQQTPIIKRLELTVQIRNQRAVHLYEKFGFLIEGTKKCGVKTRNGEFLDVFLMGKLID